MRWLNVIIHLVDDLILFLCLYNVWSNCRVDLFFRYKNMSSLLCQIKVRRIRFRISSVFNILLLDVLVHKQVKSLSLGSIFQILICHCHNSCWNHVWFNVWTTVMMLTIFKISYWWFSIRTCCFQQILICSLVNATGCAIESWWKLVI